MTSQTDDNYEESEEIAITQGKKALSQAPWLFNRTIRLSKGFFFELKENDKVHPNWYSVSCVDGVGTKLFLSAWSGNYRLAPIDGIAMNANDMATAIRAYPSDLMIYIACQKGVEENKMGEIMEGFVDGTNKIRIPNAPWDLNVGKMETASLDEIVSLGIANYGVDFGIAMTGYIKKIDIPNLNPKPGHIIVGVASTGMHSNGYTSGRHVLLRPYIALEPRDEFRQLYKGRFSLDSKPELLGGKTVLEAMQIPTALYLVDAAIIGKENPDNKDIYGINITGNGLKNFNRAGHDVSFEITDPLEPLPIHKLLVQESKWTPEEAYVKQNMGMGFAFIVPSKNIANTVVKLINDGGENKAKIVGEVARNDSKVLQTTLHKPYEGKPITLKGYNN